MTDFAVVVPSTKDRVKTDFIPSPCEFEIIKEGNVSEARNMGAEKTRSDTIVFADDDIDFPSALLNGLIDSLEEDQIIGHEGYSLGMLTTRIMVLSRETFEDIGGFDEDMEWMEDTDFSIRAEKKGYDLVQIPHQLIKHEPHEKRNSLWGGRWHLYLLRKHGFTYFKKLVPAIFKKIFSVIF